jgi:CheY-like chemotaxis protein
MKPSVVQNQNKNRRGSKYGGVRMKIAGTPHSSILIVDDDPLVSELVATQCRLAGMSVQRAPNGLRALVAARQNRPTLLITSLRLPHLDGLSLCERLLGRDAPGMDAIVMSGYFDFEDYERCDSLGATPVEKGNGFWQQLREALVDVLPADEREAISRHESWDALRQIPSTPRILIIDADPRPAQLLKSRLKKFGIEGTDGRGRHDRLPRRPQRHAEHDRRRAQPAGWQCRALALQPANQATAGLHHG